MDELSQLKIPSTTYPRYVTRKINIIAPGVARSTILLLLLFVIIKDIQIHRPIGIYESFLFTNLKDIFRFAKSDQDVS